MWRVFTIAKDKSNLESRNLGLASLGFPADKGREARREGGPFPMRIERPNKRGLERPPAADGCFDSCVQCRQ